jgi:hypothetical protein
MKSAILALTFLIFFISLAFTIMLRAGSNHQNEARRKKLTTNRPPTYRKRPPDLDRYTCNVALNIVARKVEIAKANNGGTIPYGALSGIVTKMKPTLPWLTKEMLRTHIKKLNKAKNSEHTLASDEDNNNTGVDEEGGASSNNISSTLSQLTVNSTVTAARGDKNRSGGTYGTAAATVLLPNDFSSSEFLGSCGRPKGSTINNKRDAKQREEMAIFEAARVYKQALEQRRNNDASSRLMNGKLSTIIADAKAMYNVDDDFTISASIV